MQRIRAQLPASEAQAGEAVSYVLVKTLGWMISHNSLRLQDAISAPSLEKIALLSLAVGGNLKPGWGEETLIERLCSCFKHIES